MPMKKFLLAATLVSLSTGLALAQDLAAGATTFKKCAICHDIGETAKNKVGPELNGIDGRPSGSAPGYNYSDANKKSGITWNEAAFMEYIKDPRVRVGHQDDIPWHQERNRGEGSLGLSQAIWCGRQKKVITRFANA